MFFIDYSSAFNTIQPHIIIDQLHQYNVPAAHCRWILDFLTGRSQYVRTAHELSSDIVINTGAPQGCVLSAVLFILYTNCLTCANVDCKIIKYADDTAVLGLISKNDESTYRETIQHVSKWCDDHYLQLNVGKTKELIFDFRRNKHEHLPVNIKGDNVKIVSEYKYLGCIIEENLKWEEHVITQVKKANKRLYNLYYLKKFNVDRSIIAMFYNSVIGSVLTYSIECWFPSITDKSRKLLDKPRKRGNKVTGDQLPSHLDICNKKAVSLIEKSMSDDQHPLHSEFKLLPSGKRLNVNFNRTTRFKKSFVPYSIRLYNAQS